MRNWLCGGLLATAWLVACGEGGQVIVDDFTWIEVTVVDRATQLPADGARVRIDEWQTTQDGVIRSWETPGVVYDVWAVAPGYLGAPRPFEAPLQAVAARSGDVGRLRVELDAAARLGGPGRIAGTVLHNGQWFTEGLAVARGAVEVASRLDVLGGFVFVDLPTGPYQVTVLGRGLTGTPASVEVTADTEASAELTVTEGGGVAVSGEVSGPSAASSTLYLTHAASGLPVAGLSVEVTGGAPFTVEGVPPGSYQVRTGLEVGDGWVMDPELTRRGPVTFTAADGPVQGVDVGLSPALGGLSPTASATTSATPTLRWTEDPAADFYVVEVQDMAGRTLWGGFDATGNWRFRVLAGRGEATYEGAALTPGARYRWRVYAADQDEVVPSAFTLIGASEELEGVFSVERE
ncbi:MAG: hypothetical protein H6730_12205 [Deltaproteobacteria bacterium]|nr:hypothetical protein [Deltaproteobacteria bacterium]